MGIFIKSNLRHWDTCKIYSLSPSRSRSAGPFFNPLHDLPDLRVDGILASRIGLAVIRQQVTRVEATGHPENGNLIC